MPLCGSVPATVDTELNLHGAYLTDLDKCMKTFNDALTATLNAYRNLLSVFDQVGQVYGNIAQTCSDEVNNSVKEFRDGMRELKDKGGFETFNREIHEGAIDTMNPIKVALRSAMKAYKEVRARQKDYDTVRYNLEKTEKSYAKKDKPLSENKDYQKNMVKRDKTKQIFDAKRDDFEQEINALQKAADAQLLCSLNNYLHCTATFCGQLEVTMAGYRTDTNGSSEQRAMGVDRLKEKAQVESSVRQAKRNSNVSSQHYSQGHGAASNVSDPAGDDDFYPSKKHSADNYPLEEGQNHQDQHDDYPEEQQNEHKDNDNCYPEEQQSPYMNSQNPLSLNAQ